MIKIHTLIALFSVSLNQRMTSFKNGTYWNSVDVLLSDLLTLGLSLFERVLEFILELHLACSGGGGGETKREKKRIRISSAHD